MTNKIEYIAGLSEGEGIRRIIEVLSGEGGLTYDELAQKTRAPRSQIGRLLKGVHKTEGCRIHEDGGGRVFLKKTSCEHTVIPIRTRRAAPWGQKEGAANQSKAPKIHNHKITQKPKAVQRDDNSPGGRPLSGRDNELGLFFLLCQNSRLPLRRLKKIHRYFRMGLSGGEIARLMKVSRSEGKHYVQKCRKARGAAISLAKLQGVKKEVD